MPIYVGGTQINDIKIGSTEINSVWVGANQVWVRTLIDPETGWNSTSSSGTSNSGAHYSNTVEITQNCTLKFSVAALSGDDTFNTSNDVSTYIEINSGSGFPITGGSPYYWGNSGHNNPTVTYSSDFTLSLNAGDQVRFLYWLGESNNTLRNRITVRDNSDQSILDQNIDSNHTWTQGSSGGGDDCFLADSLVTMQDLSKKRIADMQPGDMVIGDSGVINEVVQLRVQDQTERTIFNINNLQTTESHPIKTSEGWKAINPESAMAIHPEMTITQLAVGDSLTRVNAQGVEYADEVTSITAEIMDVQVYNLNVSGNDTPDINGNDTYVVNNVVVHNK